MRVSQLYNLHRTQPTLDFVDVHVDRDTPLFVSPTALKLLPSQWAAQCVHLLQDFFRTVMGHIKAGEHEEAEELLSFLKEPDETHLGLSVGRSRGRALGEKSAHRVWGALSRSRAAQSGLIEDLEDTVLLVRGVNVDIISDITTNLIRPQLIGYTQEMCDYFSMPTEEAPSGWLWNSSSKEWEEGFADLPVTDDGPLLLVPKAIVRRSSAYNLEEYFRHYLLKSMQRAELSANTSLVTVLKDGTRRVHKTALIERYGSKKDDIAEQTILHPDALRDYKKTNQRRNFSPLDHELIASVEKTKTPDWDGLLSQVTSVPTGQKHATRYEKAIEALLTAVLYPDLTHPVVQDAIHSGRKRVDITYTNMALSGFFWWLSRHYPSGSIFIECKNYRDDLANPELDQIAGRFSPSRGQVGIIVCRGFADKERFIDRCRDTARDHRGFILVLDDADLKEMVRARVSDEDYQQWPLLRDQFKSLTS